MILSNNLKWCSLVYLVLYPWGNQGILGGDIKQLSAPKKTQSLMKQNEPLRGSKFDKSWFSTYFSTFGADNDQKYAFPATENVHQKPH